MKQLNTLKPGFFPLKIIEQQLREGKQLTRLLNDYWKEVTKIVPLDKESSSLLFYRNPTSKNKDNLIKIIKRILDKKQVNVRKLIQLEKRFNQFSSHKQAINKFKALRNIPVSSDAIGFKANKPDKPLIKTKSISKTKKVETASDKSNCHIAAEITPVLKKIKKTTLKVFVSDYPVSATEKGKLYVSTVSEVDSKNGLRVKVRPTINCKLEGASEYYIPSLSEKSLSCLDFTVIPTQKGTCRVDVEVWQRNYPVSHIELPFYCGNRSTNPAKKRITAKGITDSFSSELNQIRIRTRKDGKKTIYEYELDFPGIPYGNTFESKPIEKPEIWIKAIYEKIEALQNIRGASKFYLKNEISQLCFGLSEQLIPDKMQDVLLRNYKKLAPLQLITNEALIPWEMVLIKRTNRRKKTSFTLGEIGMLRWKLSWYAPKILEVSKADAWYLRPAYMRESFPSSNIEIDLLVRHFNAKRVKPTYSKVLEFLRYESYRLFHICCHGELQNDKLNITKLNLGKGNYITESNILTFGKNNRSNLRPLIVLNACQSAREKKSLTGGFTGFADAFLKAKAGVFVGALWSIEDKAAMLFIEKFYSSLLKGSTLGEAVVLARKKAAKTGDGSWLAYSVFGHPEAKLIIK